jgi:hypothetical protein
LIERLIHPDPSKRFPNAAEAMASKYSTNSFKDQLGKACLAVNWVGDSAAWVKDTKSACDVGTGS